MQHDKRRRGRPRKSDAEKLSGIQSTINLSQSDWNKIAAIIAATHETKSALIRRLVQKESLRIEALQLAKQDGKIVDYPPKETKRKRRKLDGTFQDVDTLGDLIPNFDFPEFENLDRELAKMWKQTDLDDWLKKCADDFGEISTELFKRSDAPRTRNGRRPRA